MKISHCLQVLDRQAAGVRHGRREIRAIDLCVATGTLRIRLGAPALDPAAIGETA